MSRNYPLWRVFVFVFALFCGQEALAAPPQPSATPFTLTVLHTNDLHGHILPFAYTETGRSKEERASVGGAARQATLVRQLRQSSKNPVVLADSGDTFTRGPFTNAYEGIADVEAMNAVGYDLAALGNNEFKAKDATEVNDAAGSQAALLQVVKRARFSWVCANATDGKGAFLEGVQPYVVREFNGVRVGFLGLTAPRSASYPQTVGWSITDPIATAKEWIPKARAHCDILLAVTHIGVDLDKQLAAETTGLDAIVGGDSHTFLYKAEEVANSNGVKIPIVQDGEFGVNLGRFDLRFVRTPANSWKLAGYSYGLLPVDAKVKEAPDVAAVTQRYARPLQVVVGQLERVGATPEERERMTAQVIADALSQVPGADLGLHPASADFEVFRHREVTRYEVLSIIPFKNHVALATLTGAELEALRKASPKTLFSRNTMRLQANKTYRVALEDYLAQSMYNLPAEKWSDTGRDIRETIIAYLSNAKKITTVRRHRVPALTRGRGVERKSVLAGI